jgi:hypothetical protein
MSIEVQHLPAFRAGGAAFYLDSQLLAVVDEAAGDC